MKTTVWVAVVIVVGLNGHWPARGAGRGHLVPVDHRELIGWAHSQTDRMIRILETTEGDVPVWTWALGVGVSLLTLRSTSPSSAAPACFLRSLTADDCAILLWLD